MAKTNKNNYKLLEENSKKYNYLHFLYNVTHPQPYCPSLPYQIYIEVTNVCNLQCTHCPRIDMKRKKHHMSLELFEKTIKKISFYRPFVDLYIQGEPLLHPKIVDIVKIARSHGLQPRITTNVTMLKKDLAQGLIEAGLDKIQFSMSAASKKTYESIYKGKGAQYEKVLNNIIDFLQLNGRAGFPVHTRSTFVEEEKTKNDKEKYLELFSKLPLDDVHISPLINFFGWNKEVDLNPYKKLPMKKWPICSVPWRHYGIQSNGDVRACVFDYDSRYIVGNANETDVIELWNSERLMEFRKAVIERRYKDLEKPGQPLCTECSQLWPISQARDTGHAIKSFSKEVEAFFGNEEYAFKTVYLDKKVKKQKLEYINKNRNKWISDVLADIT